MREEYDFRVSACFDLEEYYRATNTLRCSLISFHTLF